MDIKLFVLQDDGKDMNLLGLIFDVSPEEIADIVDIAYMLFQAETIATCDDQTDDPDKFVTSDFRPLGQADNAFLEGSSSFALGMLDPKSNDILWEKFKQVKDEYDDEYDNKTQIIMVTKGSWVTINQTDKKEE